MNIFLFQFKIFPLKCMNTHTSMFVYACHIPKVAPLNRKCIKLGFSDTLFLFCPSATCNANLRSVITSGSVAMTTALTPLQCGLTLFLSPSSDSGESGYCSVENDRRNYLAPIWQKQFNGEGVRGVAQ